MHLHFWLTQTYSHLSDRYGQDWELGEELPSVEDVADVADVDDVYPVDDVDDVDDVDPRSR